MSAFIISTETMHRVVWALSHEAPDLFPGILPAASCTEMDRFGVELYALNAAAMSQRYHEPVETPDYHFRPLARPTLLEQYKALSCYLYQCAEGDVPKRPAFERMVDVAGRLARQIVGALPEYQRAPWDWPERAEAVS